MHPGSVRRLDLSQPKPFGLSLQVASDHGLRERGRSVHEFVHVSIDALDSGGLAQLGQVHRFGDQLAWFRPAARIPGRYFSPWSSRLYTLPRGSN